MKAALYSTLLLIALFAATSRLSATEITVGMGNFEPYYDENKQAGIFTDITTAVFNKMPDYQPKYIFGLANHDLWANFEAGRIDAASNLFDSIKIGACRSDPIYRFRDVAVTRADAGITLEHLSDLDRYSIVTFQGAKAFFGEDFSRHTSPKKYLEVGKPTLQAKMLYGKRYDISVGDMFIFLHTLKTLDVPNTTTKASASDFVYHDIFPQISSRLGFHDNSACKAFNIALKQIKASGEYERIYQQHLNRLGY